ncbi:MAG: hypothetical protein ABR556_12260, partial [Pyrinomonadaceae bacterium]
NALTCASHRTSHRSGLPNEEVCYSQSMQVFNSIANELRHQYSLGYYVKTPAQLGQRRQIKVRLNRPNLVVRARSSYVYVPNQ